MHITIKLYSMLRSYLKDGENGVGILEFSDGAKIADVVASLGIPAKIPRVTLINGEQKEAGDYLVRWRCVKRFPAHGGGITASAQA